MSQAAVFLINGVEETEAVTTIDILRRGQVEVITVNLSDGDLVRGKHGLEFKADAVFPLVEHKTFDMLVIPGGTTIYTEHQGFMKMVSRHHQGGKFLAAICAAPAVLGKLGLLKGKNAVCYPGMEGELAGANIKQASVETDGTITTSRGPGTAVNFGLRLLEILEGPAAASRVRGGFLA